MLVVPATSVGEPNCTVRLDADSRARRSAPGSNSSTSASMAASVLATDHTPHPVMRAASALSTAAIAACVGDQGGAPHDGAHQQVADQAGLKQRRHLG